MVRELVAIDMPAGDAFVNALRRVWESDDAALPIDQRLPEAARKSLINQFKASSLIGADGSRLKVAPANQLTEVTR